MTKVALHRSALTIFLSVLVLPGTLVARPGSPETCQHSNPHPETASNTGLQSAARAGSETASNTGPQSAAGAGSETASNTGLQSAAGFETSSGEGVVVAGDSLAAEVGASILQQGGNAVDAAVATALALAVTLPEAGNLGGGGFLLAYDPGREESWGLDFRETAPAKTDSLFYARKDIEGIEESSLLGPLSAGIPGSPAGLWTAWKRGGRLPWTRLVEPARRLAEEGFAVGEKLPRHLEENQDQLKLYGTTRRIFFPGGHVLQPGDELVQAELACVLGKLQAEGPDFFYRGTLARAMVEEVRAAGGVWTLHDLAAYQVHSLLPISVTDPGDSSLQVLSLPPPSSGGVFFGEMLAFLDALHVRRTAPASAERARVLIESMRLAFADRNRHLGDPLSMLLGHDALLDEDYLRQRALLLPATGMGDSTVEAGQPIAESVHTTHISVLDGEGGAVALTTTINSSFGSKWIVPGAGFFLNNEMDDFDTRPGKPNVYGLIGSGVNCVRGGRRMLSSMSPTIVLRQGRPWLVLGAMGGPRILSSILQVYLYRTIDGLPLEKAVAAPRLHHQWRPATVYLEDGRQWPALAASLRKLGYPVDGASWMAKVQAAERTGDGNALGASDPRSDGLAVSVRAAADGQ